MVHETMKVSLIFLILFAHASCASTVIYPIADTYLDSGNANTNYGSALDLYVYQDVYGTNAQFELITLFNISTLPSHIISGYVKYIQEYVSVDEIYGPYLLSNILEKATNWTVNRGYRDI